MVAANPLLSTVEDLSKIAATLPPTELGSVERIAFGQRRANSAVTLLRLGEREKALPVFDMTDDPEALTQFIFRCRDRGVRVEELLDVLQIVTRSKSERRSENSQMRYALLLAIGEYPLEDIPAAKREPLLKQLGDWYRNDPSSGVHGATGWLLRQWGQADVVRAVDQTVIPYTADREWFTLAITVTPTAPPKPKQTPAGASAASNPEPKTEPASEGAQSNATSGQSQPEPAQFLPKTFYFTFIVFPPGEYMIGSVEDEPDRSQLENELRHAVILERPFAILDREVTLEELIAFSPIYLGLMQQYKAQPSDAGFGADWYDSVAFCRWLSAQYGLPESDQCYADPESLDRKQFPREPRANWAPRNWPLELGRRGFRLPTESEWEVASRSGARTAYGYGSDVSMLARFGWFGGNGGKLTHPPRELRPTFPGVFDLHGGVYEWTHDWFSFFSESAMTDSTGANEGVSRVIRGGNRQGEAADCRSASRSTLDPTYRSNSSGFRLALNPTVDSGPAAQNPEK